ncbi:hypothetical protein BH23THE1_BH23THE1_00540 [soil metagenome]
MGAKRYRIDYKNSNLGNEYIDIDDLIVHQKQLNTLTENQSNRSLFHS